MALFGSSWRDGVIARLATLTNIFFTRRFQRRSSLASALKPSAVRETWKLGSQSETRPLATAEVPSIHTVKLTRSCLLERSCARAFTWWSRFSYLELGQTGLLGQAGLSKLKRYAGLSQISNG